MKKFCYVSIIALLIQSGVSAQKLTAYFSYCVFNQPSSTTLAGQAKGGPYIETYLSVIGNSVQFSPVANGKIQSKIEIQWVLKKAGSKEKAASNSSPDTGFTIVSFDKYNLLSPEVDAESKGKPNFLDQKRITAPNGDYILELTVVDKNMFGSKVTINEPVSINFPNDKLVFSDIELLESFTKSAGENKLSKSGYDLMPFISNFFSKEISSLKFYVELYNGKKIFGDSTFVFRYQIINEGNKKIINELAGYRKMTPEEVNPVVMEIPINHLSSGNYSLMVEARDKNNQVLAFKSAYFQRSNPIAMKKDTAEVLDDFTLTDISNSFIAPVMSKDTMKDYIACLYPISKQLDRQIEENQINYGTVESMKKFFYYFWAKQDSVNPEQKWLAYKEEVDKVNYTYKCFGNKGYRSDQGRVYLQYGPPNAIEIGDSGPNTYPYEIWQYYVLDDQRNRKFVFYSKFRAVACYTLLSSDARGEPYLYDWNYRLHNMSGAYDIDAGSVEKNGFDNFGDKTRSDYNTPH